MRSIVVCFIAMAVCAICSTTVAALTVEPEHIVGKAGDLVVLEIAADTHAGPVAIQAFSHGQPIPVLGLDALSAERGSNAVAPLSNPPLYKSGLVRHTEDPDSEFSPVGPAQYYLIDYYTGAFITFLHSQQQHVLNDLEFFRTNGNQRAGVYSLTTLQNVGLGYMVVDSVSNHPLQQGTFTGTLQVEGTPGEERWSMVAGVGYGTVRIIGISDVNLLDEEISKLMWECVHNPDKKVTIAGPSATSSGGATSIVLTSIKPAGQRIVVGLSEDMTGIDITACPQDRDGSIEYATIPVTILPFDKDDEQDRRIQTLRRRLRGLWEYVVRRLRNARRR